MDIDYRKLWENNTLEYGAYRDLMQSQSDEGLTSGPIQNESLANYTKLNHSRMKRLDKKAQLLPFVQERTQMVRQPQNWLVITETWCGDAAQVLPFLAKMADLNEFINLKLIWRDEHLELMDAHLTSGSRSIPKVICLNEDFSEILGTWGPRPREAQEMSTKNKIAQAKIKDREKKSEAYNAYQIELQKWYNNNKGEAIQLEMLVEIEKWQK